MTQASLRVESRQSAALTPRLQYAVRLLQLSSLEYEQELRDVMLKNPFLELGDSDAASPGTAPGAVPGEERWAANDSQKDAREGTAEAPGAADHGDDFERDTWISVPGASRQAQGESTPSGIDLVPAETGLRPHLRSQANMLPLSARDHTLVCAVIESIDDDGYLRLPLEEIAALAELDPPADACEMNTALRLVQSFEPAGIGARDVAECLLLQLPGADVLQVELCRTILTDHLERLAKRDVAAIARSTGRSVADVSAACAAVRRLDPRPGWRFGRWETRFVSPDVVVRKVRGLWVARLNADVVPRLRLNRTYADLFQRHRSSGHAEMAAHLQEARWTVRNVEQRFSTILAVSQAILERQRLFFEHGPFAMKPMGLREIAQDVGLHESTVCRVTNNKYMTTPAGVFELKSFFSRAMPMDSGGACSATAIRGVMHELIASEDPLQPLSDVEIAQRLARQGLNVARRTVTKYRQMLKILPVEGRRRHTGTCGA